MFLEPPLSSRICSEEFLYLLSKGEELQWRDVESYSDFLLPETKMDEFLKVPASDFLCFCSKQDPSGLSLNMLSDSLMFYKLHNTWQAYICPIPNCLCLFLDDDSLVLHLINEHCISCPFLQQNPAEERRCANALRTTVWRPIDARAAARLFESLCSHTDANLFDVDHLANLEWPLSHDLRRRKLLTKLQMKFEELLGSLERRKSFPLLSNGCLRALIAVASEDILARLDLTNIAPLSFRALLYCSPLSFRFMEAASLLCFLELVEAIRNLVEDQVSRNGESEGSQDSDAVFFAAGSEYFVLDGAKLNPCRMYGKLMGFWLFTAPYYPTINSKLPAEASDILRLVRRKAASFSERLTTVRGQSDHKCAALTSCLKMWNMGHWLTSLQDKLSQESASNSETDTSSVDDVPSPCVFSRKAAKRWKTKYQEYQMWPYLELIERTCELQFFELQLRQLCAFDLRTYILPLLKSCLRMKLFLSMTVWHRSVNGDAVEVEDAGEGDVMDGSQEEQSEEHLYCRFEEKTASEDGSGMMTPYKELYSAVPDPGSSGNGGSSGSSGSGITEVGPMTIDCGEALGGDPPGAHTEDAYGRVPQVGCADAAPSRRRTGTGAATAESEAKHEAIMESYTEPESKTEPESQFSQDSHYFTYPDSDPDSLSKEEEELEDRLSRDFADLARKTNESGLFVCMTINDVANHCLELEPARLRYDALDIWGLKTNPLKYWRCFVCEKRFPDQKSHMLHLEAHRDLGISWDADWSVPSQVQQSGGSGVNEDAKERTCRLDDSITVDCTCGTFIVEMEKIRSSYQYEDGGKAQDVNQFELIVGRISREICCLRDIIDAKCRLCSSSEIVERDAEVEQKFARLKKMKQELSDLCISDNKNKILVYVSSFLKKRNLMDSGSWAFERLKVLLGSVQSPQPPESFSIEVESPGKVNINIEEHDARIGFTYVGIRLKFAGHLFGEGSRNIKAGNIKGTLLFSGTSKSYEGIGFDTKIILHGVQKMTRKLVFFKNRVARHIASALMDKLEQFQAEVRASSQCQRKLCLYGFK